MKTRKNGHKYYKSSDCPICTICEKARKPQDGFLSFIVAPSRYALDQEGISTIEILSNNSEKEIIAFHGLGKSTIPKLKKILQEHNMTNKYIQSNNSFFIPFMVYNGR